jgi:molybdopterin converting factor small subunit
VAILRLFAQAREAAGTGKATFPGETVDDVLKSAIVQYGSTFEAVVNMSKVWVNGEEVPRSHAVTDKDEVAVLPPVSGGM